MQRVIVESPYSGEVARNEVYARLALLDCLARGESPYASHLLLTQVLDDTDPIQRDLGIRAGFAWREGATRVFYVDFGWSTGMLKAVDDLHQAGIDDVEIRRLPVVTVGACRVAAHVLTERLLRWGSTLAFDHYGEAFRAYKCHYEEAALRLVETGSSDLATEPFNALPDPVETDGG